MNIGLIDLESFKGRPFGFFQHSRGRVACYRGTVASAVCGKNGFGVLVEDAVQLNPQKKWGRITFGGQLSKVAIQVSYGYVGKIAILRYHIRIEDFGFGCAALPGEDPCNFFSTT